MWRINTLCTLANEDLGALAEYDPLTGNEPNDLHILEITELYVHPGILWREQVPELARP